MNLKEASTKVESLRDKINEINTNKRIAESKIEELIKECKDNNCEPENLNDEITKLEKEIEEDSKKLEEMIKEAENVIKGN